VLFHLAEQIVHPDPPIHRVGSRWRCSLESAPVSSEAFGPESGLFSDDLESTLRWVGELDESYVAVQGPPGSGKTYSGSHIIYALIKSGKRVGITAMSHAADRQSLRRHVRGLR